MYIMHLKFVWKKIAKRYNKYKGVSYIQIVTLYKLLPFPYK